MFFGPLTLVLAIAAAGWLLWRSARGATSTGGTRNITLLKGVAFLGLTAALFAVKLFPLAFMTLVAAGAISGIEIWRERAIKMQENEERRAVRPSGAMQPEEAASILGVASDAPPETIRAAHKKLISQLHPDKGGTDYLAAKINDARETLMRKNAALETPDA